MAECKCCEGQGVHDNADGDETCVPCAGTGSVSDFICGHDRVFDLPYHMCCSRCGGRQDSATYRNIKRACEAHLQLNHMVTRERLDAAEIDSLKLLNSQWTVDDDEGVCDE
jgi:hypothetical protein